MQWIETKIKNILANILHIFLVICIVLFTIFVDLSFYFRIDSLFLSILSIFIFSFSCIFVIRSSKFNFTRWGIYLILLVLWSLWYGNIKPSNDKVWQKDVAVLSYATLNENLITIHNIRNFEYTTEENYKIAYYDETYDLDKLIGIDFIATYWMGPNVAHTFLSFSFSDDKHLAISIEARKEIGESYSMIRGFFKENELYYVVADERDLIGLRTNIRKNPPEHVYMYQIKAEKKDQKKVFLNYIKKLNELKKAPEFYNTLTENCTTSIWNNSLIDYANMSFNWKILVSGFTANYLYKNGLLKTYGLSFKELQKKAYINPLVNNMPIDLTYSSKIRNRN